jgi:hypothetical protein
MTEVKKGYEAKLAIQSTILNFISFYANNQCLMRQEARLLNEKLKLFLFFLSIVSSTIHPTNLKIHTIQFKSHTSQILY